MDFAPCGDYGTAFSSEIVGGKPKGIGLSQWRVNLGGGSAAQGEASGIEDKSRRAESYLTDDLTYDWTRCEDNVTSWTVPRSWDVTISFFSAIHLPCSTPIMEKDFPPEGTFQSETGALW